MRKPLSIKILQVFFLAWGSLCLIYIPFDLIDFWAGIPSPLAYLFSFLMIVDPNVYFFYSVVDGRLFPLVVGIGALLSGMGISQFSKYSLNIARWYISVLLLIMGSYFLITISTLPGLLEGILGVGLELSPSYEGWEGLIIFSALGEFILIVTLIILVFALIKIQKVLKSNVPTRKTLFERFGKLSYLPLLLMIVWFAYASYFYFF